MTLWTTELVYGGGSPILLTTLTVDDQRNRLDLQARSLQPSSIASQFVREKKRCLVDTGEDSELQMHNLDIKAAATLGLFNDLIDHADCNREFVHELPFGVDDLKPASRFMTATSL
jgi:hypothetical protein